MQQIAFLKRKETNPRNCFIINKKILNNRHLHLSHLQSSLTAISGLLLKYTGKDFLSFKITQININIMYYFEITNVVDTALGLM